jgi:UTP-glucose-1-phosphate uridylyltransferase/mevalonate kinase
MKIFVPGRICLFGEHSDWAGGYRRINADLEKGYTLITGTNQGVTAEVKPHASKFILRATLSDGTRKGPFEVPMEREALLTEAEQGGFFSYAAGVAYQILTHYHVHGLEIDNYLTDLPVKKGLSSSAASCVLVARAFNRIYDLKMTIRGEMEYAYMGEITTPSRCGRMDQGCAYGNRPVMMVFDGDIMDVKEFNVHKDLYFVIVDLMASKDTKEILSRLNHCYPFAEDQLQRNVQQYLGPISGRITREAYEALHQGDAVRIGELMKTAQSEFDKYLQPACPSQLTAPALHKVLNYEPIQPYILGGKGVGSQGDGTAQFIVKDSASQQKVIEIIESHLKMPCLKLVIQSGRRVRKAVIPAAGFGTRLFPASKAIKKELFPIIDQHGRAKPVILAIIEEAINAGIEEVCLVVQSRDRELFEEFFKTPPPIENFNKLSKENQEYWEYLTDLGRRISFATQDTQDGFGHAVYCARDWVDNEPFLLMLGDHLYESYNDVSCARQILDVYDDAGHSVVGLQVSHVDELHSFGCVTGVWKEERSKLSVTAFYEKPDAEYARQYLHVDGMGQDDFLTVSGLYVLTPQIFDYLEENITHNLRERGEFQLTSCLDKLRKEDNFSGYIVKGQRFDIGIPEAYRQTVIDFRNA